MNRTSLPRAALIVSATALLGAIAWAEDPRLIPGEVEPRRTPVVRAVEKSTPAVVNISTTRVIERRRTFGDSFFDELFGGRPGLGRGTAVRATSLGSGLIIDADGFILTNEHVVRHADEILVGLAGRDEPVQAALLAADADSDLALLRVQVDGPLPWLPLGTSEDLFIGETAIAIGNPFGLASTVSVGVVSATERQVVINGSVIYDDFLQTDASINPGNSGGPLLNINGEVIGVNTAIRADAHGIGFAIPIDRVRKTIAQLSSPRRLRGTYLGIELEERGRGEDTTLEVVEVAPEGPADRAGVTVGQIVRAVQGATVSTFIQLNKHLLSYRAGDRVSLTVDDAGGRQRIATLDVEVVPLTDAQRYVWDRMGFVGRSLTEAQSAVGGSTTGYLVAEVRKDSRAEQLDLRPGDIFLGFVSGRRQLLIRDEAHLIEVLRHVDAGQVMEIMIVRRSKIMTGAMEIE